MTSLLIRLGALTVDAVLAVASACHTALIVVVEAALIAFADLADAMPGDSAAERAASLWLACVGAQVLITLIAVVAVAALGVCL